MKTILFLFCFALVSASTTSFADECPFLAGNYFCQDTGPEGFQTDLSFTQTMTDGVTTYNLWGYYNFITDNQVHPSITTSESYTASCENASLHLFNETNYPPNGIACPDSTSEQWFFINDAHQLIWTQTTACADGYAMSDTHYVCDPK